MRNEKEEGNGITRRIRVVSMKRDPAAFIRHSPYLLGSIVCERGFLASDPDQISLGTYIDSRLIDGRFAKGP